VICCRVKTSVKSIQRKKYMQFRVWLLSVLCLVSGVSATPNLLETAIAPVAVATKNIACTYVVGDVFGKVQKRVRVSADALRWFKAFSKKEDFAQRIKRGENAAATELKLLFAANKSDALALMTPETDDSVVVQLIVDASGAKKVVVYGFAPACPEWIVALVDAAAIAAQKGWSLGKIGVGVGVVGVGGLALRNFRSRSSNGQVQAGVDMVTSAAAKQEKLQEDLDAAEEAVKEAEAAVRAANAAVNEGLATGGAGINTKDQNGFTPAHYAVIKEGVSLLMTLKLGGANFNIKDNNGRTPAHYAAIHANNVALRIIASVANFNIKDNNGGTPAHYAAINNHRDSLQALRDGGANFNIQGTKGFTPAHEAAIRGHKEALQALRDGGARFDIQDSNSQTVNDIIKQKCIEL
jgi:hypothetical protein